MSGTRVRVATRSRVERRSRPHGRPQRRTPRCSGRGVSVYAVTNAEYNYDYADQDPINGYDLEGTCSFKTAHSFSWGALKPSCAWRAIKDDFGGRNPAFNKALALTPLPSTKILQAAQRAATSSVGQAVGRAALKFADTKLGTNLIGNKAYQGKTGVLNVGRGPAAVRIGIGRSGKGPVFRIGIRNKKIDFATRGR